MGPNTVAGRTDENVARERPRGRICRLRAGAAGVERSHAGAARTHGACLSGRHRCDGHRDLRIAPAGSVLRVVDRRLGQHHRSHPGCPGGRLLAWRARCRRAPERPAAGPHRAGRGPPDRGSAVRGATLPRPVGRRPRASLGRCRRRLVCRLAAALRPAGRAARHGDAVRHTPRCDRRRRGRRRRRPRLRPLDRRQPARHVRPRADHHPADRHPAHPARRRRPSSLWRPP